MGCYWLAKRLEGKYAAARRNPDWDDIEWDKTDSDTKPAHDWQDDVEWNRRNPTKLTAEQKKMVSEWKKLVNMTPKQLEKFMKSAEGQIADSVDQAKTAGASGGPITSGRDSARAILKMKKTSPTEWGKKYSKDRSTGDNRSLWEWAKKQLGFIKRHRKDKAGTLRLFNDDNSKTRAHLGLLIWGHDPIKYAKKHSLAIKNPMRKNIRRKTATTISVVPEWLLTEMSQAKTVLTDGPLSKAPQESGHWKSGYKFEDSAWGNDKANKWSSYIAGWLPPNMELHAECAWKIDGKTKALYPDLDWPSSSVEMSYNTDDGYLTVNFGSNFGYKRIVYDELLNKPQIKAAIEFLLGDFTVHPQSGRGVAMLSAKTKNDNWRRALDEATDRYATESRPWVSEIRNRKWGIGRKMIRIMREGSHKTWRTEWENRLVYFTKKVEYLRSENGINAWKEAVEKLTELTTLDAKLGEKSDIGFASSAVNLTITAIVAAPSYEPVVVEKAELLVKRNKGDIRLLRKDKNFGRESAIFSLLGMRRSILESVQRVDDCFDDFHAEIVEEQKDLGSRAEILFRNPVPDKYLEGLTPEEQEVAKYEIERGKKMNLDDPERYENWDSDESYSRRGGQTKESDYTKAFKDKYGDARRNIRRKSSGNKWLEKVFDTPPLENFDLNNPDEELVIRYWSGYGREGMTVIAKFTGWEDETYIDVHDKEKKVDWPIEYELMATVSIDPESARYSVTHGALFKQTSKVKSKTHPNRESNRIRF